MGLTKPAYIKFSLKVVVLNLEQIPRSYNLGELLLQNKLIDYRIVTY